MSNLDYWSLREQPDNPERLNVIIDLQRVTDLGDYPITLSEAKTQLRVTFSDDDTEIETLIKKAVRHIENYCNISIVYQRVQLIASMVREWSLPYGPVIGIESVQDSSGSTGSGPVQYTTSADSWEITGNLYNPGGEYRQKIVYTTGNFCPHDLKDCVLQVLTFLYENRGAEVNISELNKVLSNADRYKVLLWI